MREQDLAAVLFAQGVQSGLSMERVIDELGAMTWPSFVDAHAFREALAGAAETQLRQQLEQQLAMIRRKIDVPRPFSAPPVSAAAAPATVQPAVYATPAPLADPAPVVVARPVPERQPMSTPAPVSAPPVQPQPQSQPQPALVGRVQLEEEPADDELPSDATMVWTTQHGERTGSE